MAEIDARDESDSSGAGSAEREDARRRLFALKADFAARRDLIRRAFVRLRRLGAGMPADRLVPALTELAAGDATSADRLLGEIETSATDLAARVDAASMRAQIAAAEVRWRDAARHFAAAARLDASEAHLAPAARFAAKVGDRRGFDHFSALRITLARMLPEGSPERERILTDVWLMIFFQETTLDLSLLDEVTPTARLLKAGICKPADMQDALIRHLGGDPKVDHSLTMDFGYHEARRRMLRSRGREETQLEYATALYDLAQVMRWVGKRRSALVAAKGALAMRTERLGKAHADTIAALDQVVIAEAHDGRWDGALATAQRAIDLRRETFGKLHREVAFAVACRAQVLNWMRRCDEAGQTYRKAMSILRRLAPLDERDSTLLERICEAKANMHRWRHTGHFCGTVSGQMPQDTELDIQ
jgi:tetratricopeptide (TPR) repeat protein